MRRLANLIVIAAAGCGRLGFEAQDGTDAELPDAATSGDAPGTRVQTGPCRATMPIADPLHAAGTTVEVPAFGSATPEAGVTIEASMEPGGAPFTTATSAADGSYTLEVPSQGQPAPVYFALRKPGMLPSVFVPDGPIDDDVVGMYSPIATDAAVGTLYVAAGVVRKASAGTLLVMVLDCSGVPVPDATVTISPAPVRMIYTDEAGNPTASLTKTSTRGLVYGLDVPVGLVSVTATAAGASFFTHEVEILDNSHVMGTRLRRAR